MATKNRPVAKDGYQFQVLTEKDVKKLTREWNAQGGWKERKEAIKALEEEIKFTEERVKQYHFSENETRYKLDNVRIQKMILADYQHIEKK